MCDWCNRLEESLQRLKEHDYLGVPIGNRINFYPWDKVEKDRVEIELWYDKEHGMKKREFLIELAMWESNGSGTRMVAPIKYCPNCGRLLTK